MRGHLTTISDFIDPCLYDYSRQFFNEIFTWDIMET